MNTPHKDAGWIHLWADGEPLQFRTRTSPEVWCDVEPTHCWTWTDVVAYRLKPPPLRYRVAKVTLVAGSRAQTVNSEEEESKTSDSPFFMRWLTDWVEYTDE